MLNVCAHRGRKVCLGEEGNAQAYLCIYHCWAVRPDGSFIGAPIEKEQMHGNKRSKEELGLKKARVNLYGGLIFATWNIDGPSFDAVLGDAKVYLDQLRSEEHTSELQSLMRTSYAVVCLKQKNIQSITKQQQF